VILPEEVFPFSNIYGNDLVVNRCLARGSLPHCEVGSLHSRSFPNLCFSLGIWRDRASGDPTVSFAGRLAAHPPISTVGNPMATLLGGPTASTIVSPCRHADSPLIRTVCEPSMITPGPCGGSGSGVAQT
jgi:hypothetical protein